MRDLPQGILVGIDEAGYGPNLGPLVVGTSAWIVPGSPDECDLWQALQPVVQRTPAGQPPRHVQIGDSKQVYSPGKGLAALEQSVLTLLSLQNDPPATFRELWSRLSPRMTSRPAAGRTARRQQRQLFDDDAASSPPAATNPALEREPWFADGDLALPIAADPASFPPLAQRLRQHCDASGIQLRNLCVDIVETPRFNSLVRRFDNKGRLLSHVGMSLLSDLQLFAPGQRVCIFADKHGGRDRYREVLADFAGTRDILCHAEGANCSRYQIEQAEIRFEPKSERYFPVAVASMVAKYVRELSMVLFNRYWTRHLPDVRPTAGYPVDAQRFRQEIAPLCQQLGIADHLYWRER